MSLLLPNNDVEKLQSHLKSKGFDICNGVMCRMHLVPSYYKTDSKDHFISSGIDVCLFSGVDTKDGDLGCVTFSYHGKLKRKCCRNVNDRPEMLKKVFCPENADEAIKKFDEWIDECQRTMQSWKRIM